jgi:tetratricopeptide (TPR) repeat protein
MSNEKEIEEILNGLDIDPINEGAMQRLADLYQQDERWMDLADVYQRQADMSATPEQLIAMVQKLALLYEEKLGKPHHAKECWMRILDIDPDHELAKRKLVQG